MVSQLSCVRCYAGHFHSGHCRKWSVLFFKHTYQFGESLLFALFYLVTILGFTSLLKSSSMSILVTAILFLFVFTLFNELIVALIKIEPWFLINYGAQIAGNVLTSPLPTASNYDHKSRFQRRTHYNHYILRFDTRRTRNHGHIL
jgi:hypothetical protein